MKKILCVLLAVVLLVSLCTVAMVSTAAEEIVNVKAEANDVNVKVGDVIRYTYTMNAGSSKVTSIQATLVYSDNLELVMDYTFDGYEAIYKPQVFPVTKSQTMCNVIASNNMIKYNYSTASGEYFNTNSSVMITAMFKVIGTGQAEIDNQPEYVMNKNMTHIFYDGVKLDSSVKCKGVVETGTQYIIGDVDNSGVVDISDATYIQKKLVNMKVTNYNEVNADVDNSGTVDISDATYIQKYLANMKLATHIEVGKKLVSID